MSEAEKILYTACATLIGGIFLLILTEIIKSFVMIPVLKTREQIQESLSKVDFHRNLLTYSFSANPDEEERSIIRTIKKDLREAATELNSRYTMVPFKKTLAKMKFVPSPEEIQVAYSGLIYLHNSILYEGKREHIDNLIEMNDNQIDRIHAALTRKKIPTNVKPKERTR